MKNNMTWEETIIFIRSRPEYKSIVENTYLDPDLVINVEKYRKSDEYKNILRWLQNSKLFKGKILDIGSGNGITAVAFALDGYEVVAVEPDPSKTVGAGAISTLKDRYNLDNIVVYQQFAEDIGFPSESFDCVFARQSLHHANNLEKFVSEAYRVLKPGGNMITVRDHVVFGKRDKKWFLKSHPLHRFYGGENAYSPSEYKYAFKLAGFELIKEFKFFDTVVNYYPNKKSELEENYKLEKLRKRFEQRFHFNSNSYFFKLYLKYLQLRGVSVKKNEMNIPGRMYSYILKKPTK